MMVMSLFVRTFCLSVQLSNAVFQHNLYALFECNSMESELSDFELLAYVENMELYSSVALVF